MGAVYFCKQEVFNFTKQCGRVHMCRRYVCVCECEDMGSSVGVFAWVCVCVCVCVRVCVCVYVYARTAETVTTDESIFTSAENNLTY